MCGMNGCVYKHHYLLHDDQKHKPNQDSKSSSRGREVLPKTDNKTQVKADINASHLSINTKVILRFIKIKIYGIGLSLDTFAFMDLQLR